MLEEDKQQLHTKCQVWKEKYIQLKKQRVTIKDQVIEDIHTKLINMQHTVSLDNYKQLQEQVEHMKAHNMQVVTDKMHIEGQLNLLRDQVVTMSNDFQKVGCFKYLRSLFIFYVKIIPYYNGPFGMAKLHFEIW